MTTTKMNHNELNEMELNQVNGGCDVWYLPDGGDIVMCKTCGEYYLDRYHHTCIGLTVIDYRNSPVIDLEIDDLATPQE